MSLHPPDPAWRRWYTALTPFNRKLVVGMVCTVVGSIPAYGVGLAILLADSPEPAREASRRNSTTATAVARGTSIATEIPLKRQVTPTIPAAGREATVPGVRPVGQPAPTSPAPPATVRPVDTPVSAELPSATATKRPAAPAPKAPALATSPKQDDKKTEEKAREDAKKEVERLREEAKKEEDRRREQAKKAEEQNKNDGKQADEKTRG